MTYVVIAPFYKRLALGYSSYTHPNFFCPFLLSIKDAAAADPGSAVAASCWVRTGPIYVAVLRSSSAVLRSSSIECPEHLQTSRPPRSRPPRSRREANRKEANRKVAPPSPLDSPSPLKVVVAAASSLPASPPRFFFGPLQQVQGGSGSISLFSVVPRASGLASSSAAVAVWAAKVLSPPSAWRQAPPLPPRNAPPPVCGLQQAPLF